MDLQEEKISILTDVYATLKENPKKIVAYLTNCVLEKKITVVRYYKPFINGKYVDFICDVMPILDCVEVFHLLQDEKHVEDQQFFTHYLQYEKVEHFSWISMFKYLSVNEFLPRNIRFDDITVKVSQETTKHVLSVSSFKEALEVIACFFSKTGRQLDVFVQEEELDSNNVIALIDQPKFKEHFKKKYNVRFIETFDSFGIEYWETETVETEEREHMNPRENEGRAQISVQERAPQNSVKEGGKVNSRPTFAQILHSGQNAFVEQENNVAFPELQTMGVLANPEKEIQQEQVAKPKKENQQEQVAKQELKIENPEIALLKEQIQIQLARNTALKDENSSLRMILAEEKLRLFSLALC